MAKRKSSKRKPLCPFNLGYYRASPIGSAQPGFDYDQLGDDLRFVIKVLESKKGTKKKLQELVKKGKYVVFLQTLIRLKGFLDLKQKEFKEVAGLLRVSNIRLIWNNAAKCREPLGDYIQDVTNTMTAGNYFDNQYLIVQLEALLQSLRGVGLYQYNLSPD